MTTTVRRPRRTPLRTRNRTVLRRPAATTAVPAPHSEHAPPEVVPLHEAIRRVMRDMPPVPKQGYNEEDGFYFKRLEDVILVLRDLCIRHGVTVVPVQVNKGKSSHGPLVAVDVHVTYLITGPDGDCMSVQYVGEARSETDKGTATAMSHCWKFLMGQLFMIPSEEDRDGDAFSPRITNARDIRQDSGSQREQRDGRQRSAKSGQRQGNSRQGNGRQQDTSNTTSGPRAGTPAGPVAAAPKATATPVAPKAIADRLTRAASAATADAVVPILREAENAGAARPEIEAIREIGRIKRAAENASSGVAGSSGAPSEPADRSRPTSPRDDDGPQDEGTAPGRTDEPTSTGRPAAGNTAGSTGHAPRPVPPVDAPEQSPEAAARVKAVHFFNECSQIAGYTHPSDAARMFKAKHGKTLEEAEIHEIESFAAGMTPDGHPGQENGPASHEPGE